MTVGLEHHVGIVALREGSELFDDLSVVALG